MDLQQQWDHLPPAYRALVLPGAEHRAWVQLNAIDTAWLVFHSPDDVPAAWDLYCTEGV